MKKVAIQGQVTSYHHQAAKKFFRKSIQILPCDIFRDVFNSVEVGTSEYGVVAVENSLYGAINPVYDLLLKKSLIIVGEVNLQVHHCLIGLPDSKKQDLAEVYSQVMALSQCENYLDKNLPGVKTIDYHDTVASVELVKKLGDKTKAAIASKQAAELHGMKVLAQNIEDSPHNTTRFLVLSKNKPVDIEPNKTSIVLQTPADKSAGSLHKALGALAEQNVSLSSLNSRPVIGKKWHYMFYIDLDIGDDQARFEHALSQLRVMGCDVKVLGSYKRDEN
jgi:prephenate dehydratase